MAAMIYEKYMMRNTFNISFKCESKNFKTILDVEINMNFHYFKFQDKKFPFVL